MFIKLDSLESEMKILLFASLHALQGDLDKAFVFLEQIPKEAPRHFIENYPYLKDMKNDSRWNPALERFESPYETPEQ